MKRAVLLANTDARFMAEALKEARKASKKGDVPVGAVVVSGGEVVGRGHNKKEAAADPTGHAEIDAVKSAAKKLGKWRLTGTTIYVTLEPCPMCMGALIQARVARLVFAVYDPKAGAAGSVYDMSDDKRLNHSIKVEAGVLAEEGAALLKGFFKELRKKRVKDGHENKG